MEPTEKQEEKPTGQDEIDAISRQVFRHKNAETLFIKRVPKETVDIFVKFADENFIGDYGFCLKWLLDNMVKKDVEDIRSDQILAILQDHEARLAMLENKPKINIKTMLSGRKVEIPVR